ncbi:unnamed protein product [Paramecium pentaurelia]|uniref:Tetratricopeptide repeat protein n=1 Tax=Paramecium pentaurelia TaxID=43138 RepID=A0A8S1SS78_9CILI|nr:unnamed protein product [Paramecium pentaurelia]
MSNNSSKENQNDGALAHYCIIRNQQCFKSLSSICLNLYFKKLDLLNISLGELYEKLKLYDKALEDVNYSIYINNMNAKSYYQRATIYWRKKIVDLALLDCMKCVQINPNFAMSYYRIGTIMGDLKQTVCELSYYNQAIEKDENCYDAFMCRGLHYLDEQIIDLALRDYHQALYINPKYRLAYNNRAIYITKLVKRIKHQMTIIKQSILIQMILQHIIEEVKTNTLNLKGHLYQDIGDHDKALSDYNQAIQILQQPIITEVKTITLNILGNQYKNIGDQDQALNDYNQAIQLDPNFVHAFNVKGLILQDLQQLEQAIICFDKAISLDTNLINAYYNKGQMFIIFQQFHYQN